MTQKRSGFLLFEKVHAILSCTMEGWRGRRFNVSALWDAVYLWLDEPTVIEVRNLDKLPANMKTVGEWVRSVFQDLDREAPRVEVVFRP